VLLVSKPVVPPWNDSSKNLVRDLAGALRRYRGVTMTRRGDMGAGRAVYPAEAGGFAPGLRDQSAVLAALARSRDPLWHFFFAPNPRTSTVGRWAARVRRRPTVHTVCSAPAEASDLERVLFADRTVVLSGATEARFVAAGVDPERLRRIPPAVPALPGVSAETRAEVRASLRVRPSIPLAVYAGDLEVGGGAERSLSLLDVHREAVLVMACRAKTPAAADEEARLRRAHARHADRIRWVGQVAHILDLVGSADLLLLPSDDLYAKMDYPLVVMEAMAMGVPALVCAGTAAAELADHGALAPEPDDAAGEAAALLADPGRTRSLAEQGRAAMRDHFSPATMARAYEAVYDELSR
tara:strand:+ start:161 stop:1222 length:1062 start_codon:yes stop_codon:yes gene_type:complete